ncbi:MAG: ABC transporter permease subunit [Gammaproteobacteria bacterium]|nr:MAG: ABC transporter permease subunit [Gammaproteobacteria bacterium]
MKRPCLLVGALALLLITAATPAAAQDVLVIGSKKFTESVVLGEIALALATDAGAEATHLRELGGSRVLFNALRDGEIHVYPDYTGTLALELLAQDTGGRTVDDVVLRGLLATRGIRMTRPLGFNNTYALGMRETRARELNISTVSDLVRYPGLNFGFSNEFMDRADGWPALRSHYGLPQTGVVGMDHDLAYRALESAGIDVMDLYTTDAEITYYRLRALQDDKNYFPEYHAVFLYREELDQQFPAFVHRLNTLTGTITQDQMVLMNARVKIDRVSESIVAADFLQLDSAVQQENFSQRLRRTTLAHLTLTGISLGLAILIAIPLGVFAARRPHFGHLVLGTVAIVQTIPALAMFVFMIPLLGIGAPPAIAALLLYSLLPIVRNTYAGLHDIPVELQESAEALGLPPSAKLRLVELPLATRSILAGIKTSAVINVGTATLGALIGAGGYGQPILTGIRLDDMGLILEGAVPAAILALLVQGAFSLLERWVLPRGLRLAQAGA